LNLDNIPKELRERGKFCAWKLETIPGRDKPAKVPYNVMTGHRANATNPLDFYPFDFVAARMTGYDGMGLYIGDGIVGIDLDHCIAADGRINDYAKGIISTVGGYAERSPSKTGVHALILAEGFEFDANRWKTRATDPDGNEIEVYASKRFLTLTGDAIEPYRNFEERGNALRLVMDKYMKRDARKSPSPVDTRPSSLVLSDDDIIERASSRYNAKRESFVKLYAGDTSSYKNDHSSADLALCNMLAYWTGLDAQQMDRIFRTSGLMRDKWDSRRGGSTYGELTIGKAIREHLTNIYDGDYFKKRDAQRRGSGAPERRREI
jgi:putative DNA primase/helicase